jgi:hypothetical protein
MKSIINILLMGACFLCSSVFAANADPDSFNLLIEGKVLNAGPESGKVVRVQLSCDNMAVDSFVLPSAKKKFRFNLLKNKQYTLKLSQEGFVDKVVDINTAIPYFLEDQYGFFFETSLIENKDRSKLNHEVLMMPVARVAFDMKKKCFYYDKAYTDNIKKEMISKNDKEMEQPSAQLLK